MTIPTYYRSRAIDEFAVVQLRAQWDTIYLRLFGRQNHLLSFATVGSRLPQRKYLGIQEIPTCRIVGSVNRNRDFDRNFHPLKKHLSARWVQAYVLAHTSGWSPIRVYQVGSLYFVKDGHHQVSVARYLDHHYIDAEVWEYPVNMVDPYMSVTTGICALQDQYMHKDL
jgi:hypothetical protein